MRNQSYVAYLFLILSWSCTNEAANKYDFEGSWDAEWDTNPEAFQGVGPDLEYTMTGEFIFNGDEITVKANGYPDCIFGEDTISHTQKWEIKGDTLYLVAENDVYGISYLIKNVEEDRVVLNLVQDINVTLTR